MKAAKTWFEWHNDALARIEQLRNSSASNAQRVKVAFLDSGIQLSQDNLDIYNVEPSIKYKSWVDEATDWRDEAGHGTHLATLFRKISPNAIVHVGRVFRKNPSAKSADTIAKVNIPNSCTIFF